MEDREIVDLYWQRSDLAISETEQKYGRYCRTIAMNICGTNEDAEECVNDTWFRAWNRMPSERPTVLSAFLGCVQCFPPLSAHFRIWVRVWVRRVDPNPDPNRFEAKRRKK